MQITCSTLILTQFICIYKYVHSKFTQFVCTVIIILSKPRPLKIRAISITGNSHFFTAVRGNLKCKCNK